MTKLHKETVRKKIESTQLSVREFAIRNGINPGTLGMWLRGERSPKLSNVEQLAKALHCSVENISDFPGLIRPALHGDKFSHDGIPREAPIVKDAPNYNNQADTPPKAPDTIRNTPELRECIKDAMLREGISNASELNRAIGDDSVHSVERLLSGKLNWFPDVLSAVFEALKIDHDDAPISPAERMLLLPDGFFNHGPVLVRPLPVVAWANAASHLAMLASSDSCVPWKWDPETTETIPVPVGTRKNIQVFRVTGLSMEPTIHDDDIILAEQRFSFDEISDKKVVIVKFIDCGIYPDCIVCKRLRKFGKQLTLTSDNPSGLDFEIDPHDVEWLGVVVQFLSNRGL